MAVWVVVRFHPIDAGDLILGVYSSRVKADQAIAAAIEVGNYYGDNPNKDDFDIEEWKVDD